jgi:hypothetical protein
MTGTPNPTVPFARLHGRAFIPTGTPGPSRPGRRTGTRGTSWPPHGAMHGITAYALPAPAPIPAPPPPEAANAGSRRRSRASGPSNQIQRLVPTPSVSDAVGAGQDPVERVTAGHQVNLADTVCGITPAALLPTPRARDSKGADPNPNGVDLNQAVALLPTPRASDATKGSPHQHGSSGDLTLTSAIHLLPTPTAGDARSSAIQTVQHSGRAIRPGCVTLTDAARLLPTPSVADALGGHRSRSGTRSHELLLPGVAQSLAGAAGCVGEVER